MSNITKINLDGVVYTLGGSGSGLTSAVKTALLQIADKVAYEDDNGQDYYDDLYDALYPPANLVSISAVYTQSGTVYTSDTLDSLKTDLVVTAYYDNEPSETVTTYTLSGTLTAGTSTITVLYGGKSTTFTVTVTQARWIMNGLIHQWDAIDNTGSGHSSSTTTWKDLIGTWDLARFGNGSSWGDSYLSFTGVNTQRWTTSGASLPTAAGKTVEVVISPDGSGYNAAGVCSVFYNPDSINSGVGSIGVYIDSAFSVRLNAIYSAGNSVTDIKSISASYQDATTVSMAYLNGAVATGGTTSKQQQTGTSQNMVVGTNSGNMYAFFGKIYGIRIYDRILTAEEVAYNYQVDVDYYGLT